ncbi:MAG: hypothetical protein IT232_07970 [Flavobacteriales bacterium]|nr:hypothetical protein [Flavobacteriales bacterium]
MKKVKFIFTLGFVLTFFVSQSQSTHSAKVLGVINVGQKDYAVINDLATGEIYKTVLYDQNLLNLDEDLLLDILPSQDENKAKVIKMNLGRIIFAFKQNASNNCVNFCIKSFGEKLLVITYVKNNIKIIYRAIGVNNKIISKVDIFNTQNLPHSNILSTSFTENMTNLESYKLSTHKDVIEKANTYKSYLLHEEWKKLIPIYEDFLLTFRTTDLVVFDSELGRSSAFHLSIYKTIERSLRDNSPCDCLPSPFYFTSKTPFMCMKDMYFNIVESIQLLENNNEEIIKIYRESDITNLLSFYNAQTDSIVSFEELYFKIGNITPDDYNNAIDSINCLGGGALECCGNYSGCCWYWHPICLHHDLTCWKCWSTWYCGKHCKDE